MIRTQRSVFFYLPFYFYALFLKKNGQPPELKVRRFFEKTNSLKQIFFGAGENFSANLSDLKAFLKCAYLQKSAFLFLLEQFLKILKLDKKKETKWKKTIP